jgi:hypothetical protein
MKIYLNSTANLGDFLNSMPVLSGLSKQNELELIVRNEMKKFKGFEEFLVYQNLFKSVDFDNDIFMYGNITLFSSWTREDQSNSNRPIETCRYENWMRDKYPDIKFEVDDDFEIKFPQFDFVVRSDVPYVGDRWNINDIDSRRESNVLTHLSKYEFIDYNKDLLENCYTIKKSPKPFITNLTGVAVLADLLNKEQLVVWKQEDFKPEFRKGDNIDWDNGKDINKVFAKHFYGNRKSKLVHANDLQY